MASETIRPVPPKPAIASTTNNRLGQRMVHTSAVGRGGSKRTTTSRFAYIGAEAPSNLSRLSDTPWINPRARKFRK